MNWKNIMIASALTVGLTSVSNINAEAATAKDTTPPVIPVFKVNKYINLGNQSNFQISGKGEAHSTIMLNLKDGKATVAKNVKADAKGNFNVKVNATKIVEGNVTLSIQSADKAGNKSKVKTHRLVKDVTLEELSIDNEGFINSLTQSEYPVSGTADIGSMIEITLQSGKTTVTGKAEVDELGNYSADLNTSSLNDGVVTVTVKQTDIAGNTEKQSVEVLKDTKAPEAPVLFQVSPIQAANVETYFVNGVGVKNGEVEITLTDGLNDVSSIAPSDENGFFQVEFNAQALLDGEITITMKQISESGNEGNESAVKTIKDTTPPAKPVLEKLAAVTTANQADFAIVGQGEAKATVQVMVTDGTNTIIGTAIADAQGKFTVKLNLTTLKAGTIVVLATQTDNNNNTGTPTTANTTKE